MAGGLSDVSRLGNGSQPEGSCGDEPKASIQEANSSVQEAKPSVQEADLRSRKPSHRSRKGPSPRSRTGPSPPGRGRTGRSGGTFSGDWRPVGVRRRSGQSAFHRPGEPQPGTDRRTLAERPQESQWKVSGTVTEFRGANFILIRRAVLRGPAPLDTHPGGTIMGDTSERPMPGGNDALPAGAGGELRRASGPSR